MRLTGLECGSGRGEQKKERLLLREHPEAAVLCRIQNRRVALGGSSSRRIASRCGRGSRSVVEID